MIVSPTLNIPQAEFINMPHKFRAFVAGFGSGKTWVGCAGLCKHFWEFPGVDGAYYAPTYTHIRDIFFPTMQEVAADWGLTCSIKESKKEVLIFSGSQFRGKINCRSMDRPELIIGYKSGHSLVDEIDVLTLPKAELAWKKIIARMRYKIDGLKNRVDVATTPEGFKFVYKRFKKAIQEKPELAELYGLIQASTYDNAANLNDDYIPSLISTYDPQLISAYLDGQFTNLTSGTIYHAYDAKLNASTEVWNGAEDLHIGMDFNVGKMAATVHVLRGDSVHAVAEIIDGYDTPDMIRQIKERFYRYEDGEYQKRANVHIYPDASGDSRKSINATKTDIALLRQAGFAIHAKKANPPVKDRINSMNTAFCNAKGERRYFINVNQCPSYSECLQQQVWADNGEPDKKSGNDHPNDAGGYFIHWHKPVSKPMTKLKLGYAR